MSTAQRGYGGMIRRGPMAIDVIGAHYTTVFNQAIRDHRLSRRARGLLVELLSHRDGYGISLAMLIKAGPEGRDALRSALRELETFGYLVRERARAAGGQLGETRYFITDMPAGTELVGLPAQAVDDASAPMSSRPARSRRSAPESENPSLEGPSQTRRSEPRSDFPTLAEPTLVNRPHKKNNLKKTNQQNTNPLPPSASRTPESTGGGTDGAAAARGEQTLLSIARHHPELHAALATGSTLADQAPLVGRLLVGGVSREQIRETLTGRPYPPPQERTHSLAALVAARLNQLALLAAAADQTHTPPPARTPGTPPKAGPRLPVIDVAVRRHECEGQDGMCGVPVDAPGELCARCARPAPAEDEA
ncbi:hypothetical protein [Streptomyces sp. NPDC050145]|uniref:hypothetical protein n=1 Tax=Streptomyces sp. NPDC050145 TaxID=3365602 RepID=UPI0037BDAF0B